MNKLRIIFLTLYWFIDITSYSQSIKIPLVDKIGFGFIAQETILGKKVKDLNLYTGFDTLKYKNYTIKKITFYNVQDEVEDMISGDVPEDKIKAWLRKYRDTSYILYQPMPKNYAAFLDAIDSNGRTHFIIDANNNHRFDDDTEYIFDTSNIKKEYPIVNVNFEYYDGKNLKQIAAPYRINAYAYLNPIIYSFPDHTDTIKATRLDFQAYKEGVYQSGKSKYIFNLVNRNMFVYKKDSFDIVVQPVTNKRNTDGHTFTYKSTQLIEFNNGRYKIDSLSNNLLYLHLVKKLRYGGNVGAMASPIEGTDIVSGNYFALRKIRNNYVVVNFWGSWCVPCIKELPLLKSLHEKYKNISFLSVAADLPEDIAKLKALIKGNELSWPQLWVHRSVRNSGVLWDYKITEFPTTILIDPNGRIILRGSGADILDKITGYLARLN